MAYWVFKVLLSPPFLLLWRVRVEGREHVPAHGPAVLAANHQSFCDSFFLPLVLRRRLTYVAKAEYFDDWKTAWFFRAAGQIPMNRGGGDASQRALDTATGVLNAGRLLGIYPEGTRAPDHRLHKGHTGVARLSLRCDVPIIPVGIVGTRRVQPPGSRLMRPFHAVTIRFGSPMSVGGDGDRITTGGCRATRRRPGPAGGTAAGPGPDEAEQADQADQAEQAEQAEQADQAELRELTDALMDEISRLSGQAYVDRYARRAPSA
ncbi:MAG: lysophospholipid acyltransferase family protein [Acidimicrobiales bacterium]